MNLQDIADFIDLVKNPAKYETVLKRFQDEQGRLNAAIETVGKASELDKLRKSVEKEAEKNEAAYVEKVKAAEARLEAQFVIAAAAQTTADEANETARALLSEAQVTKEDALKLQASFEGRDKSLSKSEESLKQRQAKAESLIVEYNEKLAKLRSVMG